MKKPLPLTCYMLASGKTEWFVGDQPIDGVGFFHVDIKDANRHLWEFGDKLLYRPEMVATASLEIHDPIIQSVEDLAFLDNPKWLRRCSKVWTKQPKLPL